MADEKIAQPGAQGGKEPDGQGQSGNIPKERFDEVNGKLKDTLRVVEQQGKQLAELQATIKTKEDTALAEQGKFKDLYEKEKADKAAALAQVDGVKVYQEKVKALAEAEKTAMPDHLKDLIPDGDALMQLDWIAKAKAKPELWGEKKPFAAGNKPAAGAGASDDEITTLKKTYESLRNKTDINSQNARIAVRNKLATLGVQI